MQKWLWNVTKLLPPNITSFTPPSPVRDTENATRRFNITIDQVVNVTWLINETAVQINESVTDASYTTSAVLGVRNVSAIVINPNGTDTQDWAWYVTPYVPPPSPIFIIYGNVFYVDNTPVDAPYVVVTNSDTGRRFVADNLSGSNFYQTITDASEMRANDTLLIDASKDGVLVENGSVEHTVTLNEGRSGAVRVDINKGLVDLQVVAISTPTYIFDGRNNTINTTITNNGTTDSSRFNVSLAANGVVVDKADIESLDIGCAADVAFNWRPPLTGTGNHTLTVTADSDGEIDESNETNNATSVDVFVGVPDFTIVDLTFDTPVNLYDGVNINAVVANYGVMGDTVEVGFYVDDNATPFNTTEVFVLVGGTGTAATTWNATLAAHHNITAVADPKNSTPELNESNNSLSRQIFVDASDLTVTGICITGYVSDPEYPDETDLTFEYPNNVTAVITNIGNLSADALVEFCSELDISSNLIFRHLEWYHNTSNDTITQPNASKMRVHFSFMHTGVNSHVTIYDKNNNTAETIKGSGSRWSDWVDGDVIRMHAYIGGSDKSIWFTVDNYEYIFADATVSLDAHNSTNVSRIWHADPAIIANETQSRYVMWPYYNISVIADPDDAVTELNEANNELSMPVELWYPYDFTVTNITCSPERPREGEPVTIDAAIENLGFRSIDTDVALYVDGGLLEIVDVYAEANETEHVSAIWGVLPDINHLTEEHNITIVVDPNNGVEEQDELNNDKTRSINVALANLTITDISTNPAGMIIGDTVDVIATIRNNEDATINSTVWFCEENDSIDIHAFKHAPRSPIIHHITHQGALMMRAYYTAVVSITTEGTVEVYINDRLVRTCAGGTHNLAGWTEWTYGSTGIVNITLVEEGVLYNGFYINYNIDRYQTVFGNMGLTIPASESVNLSMNWTVIQKNPRLIVTTSNATNFTDISVSGTDLAVTDVSVSDDFVWDGDLVNINATITNFGGMNASNFRVAFYDILLDVYDSDPVLIIGENISRLDAGDSMNLTVPWATSLKVEGDLSYKHLIEVIVEPYDRYIEDNSTNNTGYSNTITVKRSRDFLVMDITFLLNNETVDPTDLRMGELTTINATMEITNLASCGGSINVVCYLDTTTPPIGSTNVSFPDGNGTVYAEFVWDVCAHGDHTITVIADLENKTFEFDESNNASSQPICIRAPDLVVTNLTFDPEIPEEGGIVNITADVANTGNKNASDVTVRFIDESFTDGMIHTVPYMIDSPHPVPARYDHTWTIRHRGVHKMRVHFTKIVLHENTDLYINGNLIASGRNIANLTTDWVDGDTIKVRLKEKGLVGGEWGFSMD